MERLVVIKDVISGGIKIKMISSIFPKERTQDVYNAAEHGGKVIPLDDASANLPVEETFRPIEVETVGPMLFKTSDENIRVIVAGMYYRYVDDTLIPAEKTDDLIPISEAEFLSLKQRKERQLLELKEKAYEIAKKAHAGQVDKCKVDYINHPVTVSNMCPTTESQIVGLLHDTIEDTDVTADYLRKEGFPEYLVEAVLLVTKEDGWDEESYFARIKNNPIAREVKMADLKHNSDISRYEAAGVTPGAKAFQKRDRYIKELRYLSER